MRNVAILAVVTLAVAVVTWFAFAVERAGSTSFFLVVALPYLVLAGGAVAYAHRDGVLKEWFSIRAGDFTRGFLSAVLLVAAAYAFTKLVCPPGSKQEILVTRIYLQFGEPAMLRKKVAAIVLAIVVTATAEEVVWRGLVTSLLAEQIGSRRAWIGAAVLYAAAHAPTVFALRIPNGSPNPLIVVAALGCGMVWSGLTRRYGRLLPSIISHGFFDWAVLMMFRLWGPSV